MLGYAEDTEAQFVEITVAGKIHADEFRRVIDQIEKRIEDWGGLKLLKRVDSFTGIEPSLLVDDLKFAYRHFGDIKKVAVVSDAEWVLGLSNFFEGILPFETKSFSAEEIEKAREWLRAVK